MSIEAMKQALEALEIIKASCSDGRVAHAENEAAIAEYILRQAIEQAEKQEPVAWMWKDGTLTSDPNFADGTWTPLFAAPVHASDISQERVDETAKDRHDLTCVCGAVWVGEEMVCSPRKREWVGLTDEERAECWSTSAVQSALNIEAKLKEKNCLSAD